MRLHVSHPTDGLKLGMMGPPLIPVLVTGHFKDVLEATVARVLVAHPPAWRRDGKDHVCIISTLCLLISLLDRTSDNRMKRKQLTFHQ